MPGGRAGILLAVLLSLVFPGLGQIYARAWRIGLVLLGVDTALSFGARLLTVAAPPILPALAAFGLVVGAGLALSVVAAADAVRRSRRGIPAQRPRWFRSTWFAALAMVAIGFGLDTALPFGWRAFDIPSSSMAPTLMVGDYLLADARAAGAVTPARGEVIIFEIVREPGAEPIDYVKRVIGLPGERIALNDGIVTIDGTPTAQTQGPEAIIPEAMTFGIKARLDTETLPGGVSHPIYRIQGAALRETTAEVTVPAGRLFVLGDNRDNSVDSRYAEVGFVPIAAVVGPARTLYWSRDRGRVPSDIR